VSMPTDKVYRPYHPHQDLLPPPSLQEWLPHDHVAYFVRDLVEHFDPGASEATYEDEARGGPPYHPQRMVKILLYARTARVSARRAGLPGACTRT
jgi:transposase